MMIGAMVRAATIATAACLFLGSSAQALESEQVRATHSSVRLVSEQQAAAHREPILLAVRFTIDPGWHLYWENPGQSGEPPRLAWTLPDGYRADTPNWPVPERFVVGGVVNYGYADELFLPVTLRADAVASAASQLDAQAHITWLACRDDRCVPAQAMLRLRIPLQAHPPAPDPRWAPEFERARLEQPTRIRAALGRKDDGDVSLRFPGAVASRIDPSSLQVFVREEGVVDESAAVKTVVEENDFEITLATATTAPTVIEALSGFLAWGSDESAGRIAFDTGESPPPAVTRPANATRSADVPSVGIAAALAFAFLGGLLLNLMPCVFPVLSLKVLGFVERAHGDPREVRVHGWAFTVGVMLSFWVLAATLLALRAGGEQLGWGFQLQSPAFVALLAYLMLAMALSLWGVVEFGTSLSGFAGRAGTDDGIRGSFWTGALATVVATPCTAPFMGPALGFALTQSSPAAMAIFSSLGAGMAAPYLALSYFPSTLARLPRPGAWMEGFRKVMALPLLATAAWLADVFARQTAEGALIALLAGAALLALALWLWGRAGREGNALRRAAAVAGAIAVLVALGAARTTPSQHTASAASDGFWQPWSAQRVSELRAGSTPVFVNFTAAWCLTCKVNERAIFARDDIRNLFAEHGVVALEADWTNEDAEIQQALASFGRDGIPLYVFYPRDAAEPPILLPQVPTYADFLAAFRGPPLTTSRR